MSKGLFENMSDELRNLSKEMAAMEEFKGNVKDVEEVIENINSPLTIMVMGEFSTGKSTFINALMGEAITKVDAKPTTAVITKLVYGERDRIVVHYQDGSQQECSREEFARMTAEADAEANDMHERMDYVERTLPIEMLKSMSIIDSPGLNSIKSVHEDMTRHFMDKADTVLWMFDANKPGSQTEIDALKRLNPRLTPLVLVNKIDGIDEEEGDSVEGILEGVERRLENNKIEAQGYIGISAKMAFKGKTENRDKLVQASNIGAFYDAIEEKVLPGREQYKRYPLLDGLVKVIYIIGERLQEIRTDNVYLRSRNRAAYLDRNNKLEAIQKSLENAVNIMLSDIEEVQIEARKQLDAPIKAFSGMLRLFGICAKKDSVVARQYLTDASKAGDEAAKNFFLAEDMQISGLMEMSSGNDEVALGYFQMATELGNIKAEKNIIEVENKIAKNLYEEGLRLYKEKKYDKAISWIEESAENGCVMAVAWMGYLYESGGVVKPDYDEAIKWHTKAANAGVATSMNSLGTIYSEIQDRIDYDVASYWYKKAIEAGNEEAKENLKKLIKKRIIKWVTYQICCFITFVGHLGLECLTKGLKYIEHRKKRQYEEEHVGTFGTLQEDIYEYKRNS